MSVSLDNMNSASLSAASTPTLQEYLAILRRRRMIVAYSFLLITLLGVVLTLLTPPTYRATARLLVEAQGMNLNSVDAANPLSALFAMGQKQNVQTQVEELQAAPLLDAVRRDLGKEASFLLNVDKIEGTSVVVISAESNSPDTAARVPMLLMQAYLKQDKEASLGELRGANQFVDAQRKDARRELDAAEVALRRFKQQYRVADLDRNRTDLLNRVADLQGQTSRSETVLQATRAQLAATQALLKKEPTTNLVTLAGTNQTRATIKEEIRRLSLERDGLTQQGGLRSSHPKIVAIDAQMKTLRAQLAAQPLLTNTQASSLNDARRGLQASVANLQTQIASTLGAQAAVAKDLAVTQSKLNQFASYEATLNRLTRARDAAVEKDKNLSLQGSDIALREKAYRPGVRVMEPTVRPSVPIRPRKAQNIIVFTLFGLFVGVCLGLLQEYLDDRINTAEDADRVLTGLTTLGHIPSLSAGDAKVLPVSHQLNPAAESYRVLRTNIHFASIDRPIRSLVITSSGPGEGKSTTAINLAFAMALDGKKVILVDTDLRRPTLHKVLNLSASPGMTDALLNDARLEDVLQEQPDVPNLRVITVGSPPPNPSELLNSLRFHSLFNELNEWADIVIYDSPPVLAAADAQILASQVDGVVFVVEMGATKKSAARQTRNLLMQARAHILGVSYNKVKADNSPNYYYQYSSRYSLDAPPAGKSENKRAVVFTAPEALTASHNRNGNGEKPLGALSQNGLHDADKGDVVVPVRETGKRDAS